MDEKAYHQIQEELKAYGAQLILVTKKHALDKIQQAYDWGQLDLGENRARELRDKHEELPREIRWHMIGPLQSNKVKYIVDYVHLVHSVDRRKILKEINKRARKIRRTVPVLLQVHIAREEQKHGFDEAEVEEILGQKKGQYPHIRFSGLMGMATLTDNEQQIESEFKGLRKLFEKMKKVGGEHFQELSMGMSGDYKIALEQGATMVRIGSLIMGPRPD